MLVARSNNDSELRVDVSCRCERISEQQQFSSDNNIRTSRDLGGFRNSKLCSYEDKTDISVGDQNNDSDRPDLTACVRVMSMC